MVRRILVGISALLAGVLVTWAVVNAGVDMKAPDITNETWLNSAPLHLSDLKGKQGGDGRVLDLRLLHLPKCRTLRETMASEVCGQGFRDHRRAFAGVLLRARLCEGKAVIQEHDIHFPIPIDNDFSTWNCYGNRYWPAMYLIDKQGVIRHVRIGEGGYQETERLIQSLLAETF